MFSTDTTIIRFFVSLDSLTLRLFSLIRRLLLFALPSIRLGGNIHQQQQPRKALEQQHQHQHRWWQHAEKQNEDDERGIDAIADDLDVDALFELEEVKPHEVVEEHQTSSRGDREHARAPSMEGDDEEEEREAFEATEGGGSRSSNSKRSVDSADDGNVAENKDAIGAGGEEEEDKLENLDMSWSEKEEHRAIREEEGNAARE